MAALRPIAVSVSAAQLAKKWTLHQTGGYGWFVGRSGQSAIFEQEAMLVIRSALPCHLLLDDPVSLRSTSRLLVECGKILNND
jgi:hypothetical protein